MNIEPAAEALAAQCDGFLEYMPDAIVLLHSAGQIVLKTELAEAFFGCAHGELRGKFV